MADPFLGEIRMFAGNFAPRGWAFCDGQLLAVSQNDALFALFGTIYGGDGRTTFGLPDMRGRIPIHPGQGPGLSPRRIGERGGAETLRLSANEMASHTHSFLGVADGGGLADPGGAAPAVPQTDAYAPGDSNRVNMSDEMVSASGGGQPHTNVQPFLCVHFIVALFGIFPSRN